MSPSPTGLVAPGSDSGLMDEPLPVDWPWATCVSHAMWLSVVTGYRMGGQGLPDRCSPLTKLSSLSPSHISASPWVFFLGLDHTWGHGPVYFGLSFCHVSGLLWVAPEPLWCGNPQRTGLMKEEELEVRAQRTPAPSCAHGHQAVTKLLMPPQQAWCALTLG